MSSSGKNGQVTSKQRRNAQRAAKFRNSQPAAAKIPLPVPVVSVSRPQGSKASLKLPNNQIWVCKKAKEWGAKTSDYNDALTFTSILEGIPEIKDDTKNHRLIIGFVAESDGSFGIVEDEKVNDGTVPDPPVVGRMGFKKHTYKCRDINLEGKTRDELKNRAIVWCLEENRKAAKRVAMTHYWIAIDRPPVLMPPEDILVDGNQ
ncbi:putative coat protein [Peanut virus C]|nr:putative coat protein [Peanut virus C]